MAGHSKWHNIQHRKGAQDRARSKIFSKHSKLITIAARGNPDPEQNPALKAVISNAKSDNVPNDNISRALKKAMSDKSGDDYHELSYEVYAPGGVAVIIDALSDNVNRTFTNVRTIVTKRGGNMGASGAVSWMFHDKGNMELILPDGFDKDDIEMAIIEAGAEDLEFGEDRVFITTAFSDLGAVRDELMKKYTLEGIKTVKVPENEVAITDAAAAQKFLDFIAAIEEDEDVSDVYHNAEISEEILKNI
ncbi:YebC/PmpR family DNA-binding transcriptional regulator [Candidatus Peregrinibacteria bacterium]|nr:MAG: YebC/PmpR family DNA-binding transcriptional regulator [Candidatus Peregrinibacteria bacterium]